MENNINLRLQQQRKLNNYSQEELADKIGVSRQAVSKWERGESLPDTDNLIALSRLYGISLDELLNTDFAKDNADDKLSEKTVESQSAGSAGQARYWWVTFPLAIVAAIAMIVWGMLKDAWGISWVCFLAVPFIPGLIGTVKHKNPYLFLIALPVVAVYCLLGYYKSLWHPSWVLFLIIPLYYTSVVFIRNICKK